MRKNLPLTLMTIIALSMCVAAKCGATEDSSAPNTEETATPKDGLGALISGILGEIDDRWGEVFQASGQSFSRPKVILFRDATNGGRCGMVEAAAGPFYCAPDRVFFLDAGVFSGIKKELGGCVGNACKAASAYVIALQAGHHAQNLLGILPRVTQLQQQARSKVEANALQVKLELQADCLSGVWFHLEEKKRPGFADQSDIDAVLRVAAATGDDSV